MVLSLSRVEKCCQKLSNCIDRCHEQENLLNSWSVQVNSCFEFNCKVRRLSCHKFALGKLSWCLTCDNVTKSCHRNSLGLTETQNNLFYFWIWINFRLEIYFWFNFDFFFNLCFLQFFFDFFLQLQFISFFFLFLLFALFFKRFQ